MKKIAITIKDDSKIWNNGLTQNGYFLIKLLKKAGYDVDPVSEVGEAGKKIGEFEIQALNPDTVKKYDIVMEVAYSLTNQTFDVATKNKIKVIAINYGNTLVILQEDLILRGNSAAGINRPGTETWMSPHYEFQKGFLESLIEKEARVCPYIWSPEIFEKFCKLNDYNPFFSDQTPVEKIGIFEPNINISKTSIYPVISLEILERRNPKIIDKALMFNGLKLKENPKFKEITKNFDILNNHKISVEGRFPMGEMFGKKIIGNVLSHHMYNDLNYVTLEALHCNMPIIHNSVFCKDGGYYYEMFDANQCADQIEKSILSHRYNIDSYKKSSKEVLYKFSMENPENINGYIKLIEELN